VALEDQTRNEQTVSDFAKARTFFRVLSSPDMRGSVRTAAQLAVRAVTEPGWTLRFLLLWVAVECLFGPEDARGELSFQLSQRVALYVESDPKKARDLCARVKASYTWRSKIVHGLRLSKLKEENSYMLLVELEEIVRRSLVKVLDNDSMAKTFDGKRRDEFLDGLAFQ